MYLFYLPFPPEKKERDSQLVDQHYVSVCTRPKWHLPGSDRVQPWPAVGEGRGKMGKMVRPGKQYLGKGPRGRG